MLTIALVICCSLLLDWYAFQSLKTLTANWKKSRASVFLFYWLIMLGSTLNLSIAFYIAANSHQPVPPYSMWAITIFLPLFITKTVLVLTLVTEDIVRFLSWISNRVSSKTNRNNQYPARRKFISQLGVVLGSIPFAAFVYGIAKGKYDYKVHRHTLYFEDLPEAFDGFTITQLSDIHSGSFGSASAIQRGIDLANAQKSDLFVFTGDLINNLAEEMDSWLAQFRELKAPFGQFSILGNHDYGEYVQWASEAEKEGNIDRVKAHHKNLDYHLLLNEHTVIEKDGQQIELLGVENWGNGFIQRGDLDKALEGTNEESFKILLSHDPSHWEEKVKNHPQKIHLTLSGHTHGAQMGIETPTVKWSPIQYRYPHWEGLKTENDRSNYINRGFGVLAFSGRVGVWPEITVLELRKKSSESVS